MRQESCKNTICIPLAVSSAYGHFENRSYVEGGLFQRVAIKKIIDFELTKTIICDMIHLALLRYVEMVFWKERRRECIFGKKRPGPFENRIT